MSLGIALLAAGAAQFGGSIYSGTQAMKASAEEASLIRQQAILATEEANAEAKSIEEDADKLRKRQKILFLKSGVGIEGSPLLILEETQREGEKEADAIRKQGLAKFELGMRSAKQTVKSGRAQLIGSTVQGLANAGMTYFLAKEGGLLSNKVAQGTSPSMRSIGGE